MPESWFDGRGQLAPAHDITATEHRRAQLTVARAAHGPEDLRRLLDMLGLLSRHPAPSVRATAQPGETWGTVICRRNT